MLFCHLDFLGGKKKRDTAGSCVLNREKERGGRDVMFLCATPEEGGTKDSDNLFHILLGKRIK